MPLQVPRVLVWKQQREKWIKRMVTHENADNIMSLHAMCTREKGRVMCQEIHTISDEVELTTNAC